MLNNIHDLVYFTTVVETGSLSAAAKQLNVPKSKISRRLAQLEVEIGSPLLVRSTRSQALTQAGHNLYKNTYPHIEALSAAEQTLRELLHEPKGKLKILLPLDFFSQVVSNLVSQFALEFPLIELDCYHYDAEYQSKLRDMDLCFVLHEQPLPDSDFIARPLISFPQSVYRGAQFAVSESVDLSQLSALDCVLTPEQNQWFFRQDRSVIPVQVSGRVKFASPQMRLEATAYGLGLSVLPHYIAQTCNQKNRLIPIQLSCPPIAQQLSVVYQTRALNKRARTFLDFFQDNLGHFKNQ